VVAEGANVVVSESGVFGTPHNGKKKALMKQNIRKAVAGTA